MIRHRYCLAHYSGQPEEGAATLCGGSYGALRLFPSGAKGCAVTTATRFLSVRLQVPATRGHPG